MTVQIDEKLTKSLLLTPEVNCRGVFDPRARPDIMRRNRMINTAKYNMNEKNEEVDLDTKTKRRVSGEGEPSW